MKNIVYSFLLLSLSLPAFAAWSPPVKVTDIFAMGPDSGSGFIVVVSEPIGVSAEVGTCEGTYHYLNVSTEKGKMMFSIVLTARTTDASLRLDLEQGGSVDRCTIAGIRY